jgi:hypothetical protein
MISEIGAKSKGPGFAEASVLPQECGITYPMNW